MKGPCSPKGFYSKFLELLSVPLNGLLLYYQLLVLCVCIQKKTVRFFNTASAAAHRGGQGLPSALAGEPIQCEAPRVE